ncbi:porin [Uliginosibacterium sp. 31-16]|uniref:porin n=1 Tax=Uliginosibacterium sp. 31-16 TaxID=3068315 RepID=UPI00273D66EF|nr:porin [Uliginosibacterium sp. 31-16]MDP5241237.1 porin [Uliginosibacterium sp. 31-16]
MQKKLIALAVAGLMSGAAFAQTSVTVGGKFDACYQFARAQSKDADGNMIGTKESQEGGCNSTTRVSIGAKETIAPGYEVRVDFDLRFGNVHEGKGFSQDSSNKITSTGGLNSNDKKAMAFTTPFGTLQWGTANLASNEYKLAEKPYMVTPKDTELVKFGVSQFREESLTNRNTTYWSPTFNLGPVKTLVKATYAIGDNQKGGNNDSEGGATLTNPSSGNVYVIGSEGVIMDGIVDWGFDVTDVRPSAAQSGAEGLGRNFTHAYLNIRPIPGNKNLKLSTAYNVFKGASVGDKSPDDAVAGYYKEKTTNFVLSYNFDGKAEVGLGVSHLMDMGSGPTGRNSGKSIMIGGSYFLSKSVQVYANLQKTDFERQEKLTNGKYVGNAVGFSGDATKADATTIKVGIMKEF